MTEKKKQEKSDKKMEEKRVKPTVIRRRAVQPVEAEGKESVKETETGAAAAKITEVAAPEEQIKPARGKKVDKIAPRQADKEKTAAKPAVPAAETTEKKFETAAGLKEIDQIAGTGPVVVPDTSVPPARIPEGKQIHIKKEIKITAQEKPARKKQYEKRGPFGKFSKFERLEKFHKVKPPSSERELKKTEITVPKAAKRVIKISDAISVGDLSQRVGVKAGDIIKKLMNLGIMATINQFIDVDAATLVATDFGYEVEKIAPQEDLLLEDTTTEHGELNHRAPVVTVMGHVDHGKTSLLDAIRKTNVAAGEAGGITQHIGAYHVHLEKGDITFLDTPGHEAFTAMRARGAKVTDIVVLVVAADDGVMPQTVEAINHARAAEVPIIVAINKIDKPDANMERVKRGLSEHGLMSEEWGGDATFVPVSAKTKEGIPHLLEMLLLQADILELKANPDKLARGTIIEAKLDRGRGPVATVLVQEGTLRVGDSFVCGVFHGRVRAMIDDKGQKIEVAPPSSPVEILGLQGVPQAGDSFVALTDEAKARQVAEYRHGKQRESELVKTSKISLERSEERRVG